MRRFAVLIAVLLVVYGVMTLVRRNSDSEQEQQDAAVPLPDRTYSAAAFDTIKWEDEAAAIARGKDVYNWVCAKCHGTTGKGDGGEVLEGDTLHPPSFVAREWRFANDTEGLWQRIYLGNNRGMPHWGEVGLQPRDVMAVATYTQKDLRKQVALGQQ